MARLTSYTLLAVAALLATLSCDPREKRGRSQMLADLDHAPTAEDRQLAEAKAPLPFPAEPYLTMTPDGPGALMLEDVGESPRPPVLTGPQRLDEPRGPTGEPK